MKLDANQLKNIVRMALNEDISSGDITTRNLIPPTHRIKTRIIAGDNGIIAGLLYSWARGHP